ncbi:unnamed protein product [Lampetra planeri]
MSSGSSGSALAQTPTAHDSTRREDDSRGRERAAPLLASPFALGRDRRGGRSACNPPTRKSLLIARIRQRRTGHLFMEL